MCGMGDVLAWMTCCRGWHACVDDVLAWVTWVACLRRWRAGMGGMLLLFLLLSLKYYPEKKNLNVSFETKVKKCSK